MIFTLARSLPRQAQVKSASFSSVKRAPLLHRQLADADAAEKIRYITQSYAASGTRAPLEPKPSRNGLHSSLAQRDLDERKRYMLQTNEKPAKPRSQTDVKHVKSERQHETLSLAQYLAVLQQDVGSYSCSSQMHSLLGGKSR